MGQSVVHFEIIGSDPAMLRSYYAELFGWDFHAGDAATEAVSQPGNYGFVEASATGDGINGGIGGGEGYEGRVLFYVSVPSVEAALEKAESLGGTRRMGPEGTPGGTRGGTIHRPRGASHRRRWNRVDSPAARISRLDAHSWGRLSFASSYEPVGGFGSGP